MTDDTKEPDRPGIMPTLNELRTSINADARRRAQAETNARRRSTLDTIADGDLSDDDMGPSTEYLKKVEQLRQEVLSKGPLWQAPTDLNDQHPADAYGVTGELWEVYLDELSRRGHPAGPLEVVAMNVLQLLALSIGCLDNSEVWDDLAKLAGHGESIVLDQEADGPPRGDESATFTMPSFSVVPTVPDIDDTDQAREVAPPRGRE